MHTCYRPPSSNVVGTPYTHMYQMHTYQRLRVLLITGVIQYQMHTYQRLRVLLVKGVIQFLLTSSRKSYKYYREDKHEMMIT